MITHPPREGQAVTYHGSHTELHGQQLTAHICRCHRAHAVEAPRYELRDTSGRWLLRCVRPRSITPA